MEQQLLTIKEFQAALTEAQDTDLLLAALRQLETIAEPQQIVTVLDASDLLAWGE